ncbi:hypothetical protein J6W34_03475 [bacterium]|nr:hypothetical protein [bacterium]
MINNELKEKFEAMIKIQDDVNKLQTVLKVMQNNLFHNVLTNKDRNDEIENIIHEVENSSEEDIVYILKSRFSKDVLWCTDIEKLTNGYNPIQYTFYFKFNENEKYKFGITIPILKYLFDFKELSSIHYGMFVITIQSEWDLGKIIFESYDLLDIKGFIKKMVRR